MAQAMVDEVIRGLDASIAYSGISTRPEHYANRTPLNVSSTSACCSTCYSDSGCSDLSSVSGSTLDPPSPFKQPSSLGGVVVKLKIFLEISSENTAKTNQPATINQESTTSWNTTNNGEHTTTALQQQPCNRKCRHFVGPTVDDSLAGSYVRSTVCDINGPITIINPLNSPFVIENMRESQMSFDRVPTSTGCRFSLESCAVGEADVIGSRTTENCTYEPNGDSNELMQTLPRLNLDTSESRSESSGEEQEGSDAESEGCSGVEEAELKDASMHESVTSEVEGLDEEMTESELQCSSDASTFDLSSFPSGLMDREPCPALKFALAQAAVGKSLDQGQGVTDVVTGKQDVGLGKELMCVNTGKELAKITSVQPVKPKGKGRKSKHTPGGCCCGGNCVIKMTKTATCSKVVKSSVSGLSSRTKTTITSKVTLETTVTQKTKRPLTRDDINQLLVTKPVMLRLLEMDITLGTFTKQLKHLFLRIHDVDAAGVPVFKFRLVEIVGVQKELQSYNFLSRSTNLVFKVQFGKNHQKVRFNRLANQSYVMEDEWDAWMLNSRLASVVPSEKIVKKKLKDLKAIKKTINYK